MSLNKFVGLLMGTALAVLLSSALALYFVAGQRANADRGFTARLVAESQAQRLSGLLALLTESLNGAAQDPRLASLIAAGPSPALTEEEERLRRLIPGALQIRLLPENVNILDESRSPHMGFADLDMVRQAQAAQPPVPSVHAANTADVHLAIARRLARGPGVILASLKADLLGFTLATADGSEFALQLRQDTLPLSDWGDAQLLGESPDGEVAVPNSTWKIAYWLRPAWINGSSGWYLLTAVGFALLFALLGQRLRGWLVAAARQDQESVLALIRDFLHNRTLGNYPLRLADNELIVRQIAQLRRTGKDEPEEREEPAGPVPAGVPAVAPPPPASPPLGEPPPPASGLGLQIPASIFRAYDIRGVVGKTLTGEIVHAIAKAIGSEAQAYGEQRVIVARDGRLSSPELVQALIKGLQDTGRTVIDLGLVPTPLLYYATQVLQGRSGVMLTGSHNPAEYNGLKIIIAGETLAEDRIQALRSRVENGDFVKGAGKLENRDLVPDYIERIMEDIQLGRPMKIVMDCGNGVAAKVAPLLMTTLGCELVELYCEVDGHFPNHHPDPGQPENLASLIKAVIREQADLGIAYDGDGDRLGVVDSSGKIIWPDRQMMIFAADVLSRQPGADIIYDVKCSRHLASQIVKNGGRPLMWKTGHSLLKAKLRETGAMLAGEMSGHIFFQERWYGFDDALYASARLIEILSGDPRSTAEVFAELPDSPNTPELSIPMKEGENFRFMEALRAVLKFPEARITDVDGLRADFFDGWGLVRASNTTPAVMVRFEADTEAALARIQGQFKAFMLKVEPKLQLPF